MERDNSSPVSKLTNFTVDTEESVEYRTCLKNTNRTTECLKYGITAAKFIRLTSIHSIRDFGILDRPNVFVVHRLESMSDQVIG